MGRIYLSDFICPKPSFEKEQSQSYQWLKVAYQAYQENQTYSDSDYERLLKRVSVSPEQIAKRGYFLSDFHQELKDGRIFQTHEMKGISERQKFFLETTERVVQEIFETRPVSEHLIHVTCTGYVSPSPLQRLAAVKSPESVVTHCYHMGCYAAFPALRMASGFLHSEQMAQRNSVDIVHTELCTLHLNPKDPSLEQIVIQTLFADGVAAYRVSCEKPQHGFEVLHLTELLVPNSTEAMAWGLSETSFEMTLSKDVPSLIQKNLREAFEKWERQSQMPIRSWLKDSIIAVHPGGPKIIDYVKEILELSEEQVQYSRKVLREKGNMSSATVPHIWKEILKDDQISSGKKVISMAFGPGLTLSLGLLQVVK